jgi:membrane-associated protease RseP (regulator of RpoE activity)
MFVTSLIVSTILAMLIHELGHFTAARSLGVSCSEVGLGLGPKVFAFKLGSVGFSLRAIPLGSFVMLDGSDLKSRSVGSQLRVHLGGIVFNLVFGLLGFGTAFGWLNLLLAAGNLLPLYQHDGWKCGVVIMRKLMHRKSQSAEWAFTFSGGFVSLVLGWLVIRMFM